MWRVLLCLALACASACARGPSPRAFDRQSDQNVLLVTIDTLRADALGCYGGQARTPAIDALAASGVRFTFAHAHSVLTLPSHASILTGTYPFQHAIRENAGYRLPSGTSTLATRLKRAGFATGAFVAALPLDARFGLGAGFDVYDGRFDDRDTGAAFTLPERRATDVVARATTWMRAQSGRWFAWVHVYEPHAPYRPPPPFDSEYAAQPYLGEVAAADRALAPLFDLARAAARPTLVIVTGDHGEALGDHGEATHGLFAYEATLRVPLILSRAGGTGGAGGAGETSDALARHVDIVPTVLDVLGMPVPADLPGHSLRTGLDRQGGNDRPSYFEAMSAALDYGAAPLAGLLSGRDKYISLPIPELYDLSRDAAERDNMADRDAARRELLDAKLKAFAATGPAAPRAERDDVSARLRSLGYVSPGASAPRKYTDADDPKRLVDIDRAMHEAVTIGEAGRLPAAAEIYARVLGDRPGLTAASRHLAFAYWRMGDAPRAVAVLRRALEAANGDAGVRIQLGSYLSAIGRSGEAIAVLTEAAKADTDLDALNALGLALARAGRDRDALAVFTRALHVDADDEHSLENAAAVELDAGRLDEARTHFGRAVQVNPSSSDAHAGLALASAKAGDLDGAIGEWKRAVALDAANFDALYNVGVQLARQGRIADAKPYLEQFARTAPAAQYAAERRNVAGILATMK